MAKQTICSFCRNEISEGSVCFYCGNILYNGTATLFYGEKFLCIEVYLVLTDKYLLLKSNSGSLAASQFGLIGALVNVAVQNSDKNIGFYDIHDFKYVLNPCPLKGRKKECMFRFVNCDETDVVFALYKKEAVKLADALLKVGIPIQDASTEKTDKICCHKPFINRKTFNTRVANSARSFVQLTKDQFIVPSLSGTDEKQFNAKCEYCGAVILNQSKFCTQCGNPTVPVSKRKKCPNCHIEYGDEYLYCKSCGAKLVD